MKWIGMGLCICVVAPAVVAGPCWFEKPDTMVELSSLRAGCRIECGSRGFTSYPALWLSCGEQRFLLLGRGNLEGQVQIQTPDQALDYARLFSQPETWYVGSENPMIEVTAGDKADPDRFVVTRDVFRRCCQAPAVTSKTSANGETAFLVTRTVVEKDYRVYVISEAIKSNGAVVTPEKKRLKVDGRTLGEFPDPGIM